MRSPRSSLPVLVVIRIRRAIRPGANKCYASDLSATSYVTSPVPPRDPSNALACGNNVRQFKSRVRLPKSAEFTCFDHKESVKPTIHCPCCGGMSSISIDKSPFKGGREMGGVSCAGTSPGVPRQPSSGSRCPESAPRKRQVHEHS